MIPVFHLFGSIDRKKIDLLMDQIRESGQNEVKLVFSSNDDNSLECALDFYYFIRFAGINLEVFVTRECSTFALPILLAGKESSAADEASFDLGELISRHESEDSSEGFRMLCNVLNHEISGRLKMLINIIKETQKSNLNVSTAKKVCLLKS